MYVFPIGSVSLENPIQTDYKIFLLHRWENDGLKKGDFSWVIPQASLLYSRLRMPSLDPPAAGQKACSVT